MGTKIRKKMILFCKFQKSIYLCTRLTAIRSDSLAQQVEHNTFNVGVLGSSPRRITENKRKTKQIPDNQTLSGIFIFSKYCISPQKTVMITGEIGGLDIYLKKSTELDHISLIFRFLRGSKPTRKN